MGRWKISMAERSQVDAIMADGEWRTSREIAVLIGKDCKHTSASINYWLVRKSESRYKPYVVEGRNRNKKFKKMIK